jgi:hypothetical protein
VPEAARRSSSRCPTLPTRLQINPLNVMPGSKLLKPCASAAVERAMPAASHTSTMGAPSQRAISALEPERSLGLAPSNRPITPSISETSLAWRTKVELRALGPINQLSRLCTERPLARR